MYSSISRWQQRYKYVMLGSKHVKKKYKKVTKVTKVTKVPGTGEVQLVLSLPHSGC